MLEECALPYKAIAVDIGSGDQFRSDFLAISPNNKIPAIVDPDGPDRQPISLFESGPSCCTWRARPAASCPTAPPRNTRCCSG